MTDIERAKELLKRENASVAAVKGGREFVSHDSGVAPLLALLEDDPDMLRGASVADRIIGRASALLILCGGAREAYGETMSRGAAEALAENKTPFSFGVMTERITDRRGTGVCPMEKCVEGITDPETARVALKKRHLELKAERERN